MYDNLKINGYAYLSEIECGEKRKIGNILAERIWRVMTSCNPTEICK